MQPRKRRRKPMIDFILIAVLASLTAAVVFFVLTDGSKQQATEKKEKASHISTQNSAFEGISIATDTSNNPKVPYALHYPKTENDAFNKEVRAYITTAKKAYLKELEQLDQQEDIVPSLNIDLETVPFKEHFFSFVLTNTTYTGGADEKSMVKTYFYDNNKKEQVSIATLLDNNQEYLDKLATYVQNDLLTNADLQATIITDNVLAATTPQWDKFERFAIRDDILQFYFDDYEVTASASSTPTVNVPLNFINPILAEAYQVDNTSAKNILSPPVRELDPDGKYVALTFDDGPEPGSTEQILDILDKYNAKATFFLLGNRVQYYPEIVQEELKRGHEIGNHSWSHPVLTNLSVPQVQQEVNRTEEAIRNAIGQGATVFRPPYGAVNDTVRAQIPTPVILWSIDTLDWKHRNASQLLPMVQSAMHNHATILMHDIHQSTADGLDSVLAYLSGQGYEFITVSEMEKLTSQK